jgi:2,3-bisphosphoglycerate-dependent phosphoglycerate mutase
MTGKLVIVRHGESNWNAQGKWTGTRNVHLSDEGQHEAELMGQTLQDISFDHAFYTEQIRTTETLKQILKYSPTPNVPLTLAPEFDERDYGIYTGKNKWQVKEAIGEDAFQQLRRSWDYPIPGGETIKDVYARAVPYYLSTVLPLLSAGHAVLIVAHGNSIRALMKYLESISDANISQVEMIFGTALLYEVDADGLMITKSVRTIDSPPPPA